MTKLAIYVDRTLVGFFDLSAEELKEILESGRHIYLSSVLTKDEPRIEFDIIPAFREPKNIIEVPEISVRCKRCSGTESKTWYKCCPIHTEEHGTDFVCLECKDILHPPKTGYRDGRKQKGT